ncbi:hypothetical protein FQN60_005330 [Etheostoma spectabile]|uniref:Uncharacterized protein n=1 Tax=Etheostoma spectabile TaxID=54343 RepID=A0A5J5C8W7_9PERO|nr:hypothetical protein FQN60_005330 [Etheostoma spectabile]
MDQRHTGTNPVRPSSPRPIHRRIPAAASQSGFPPDTDAGSSAGKPLTLETDQRRKMDQRRKGTNPVRPSSPRPIHRRIPAAAPTNVVRGQETLVQTPSDPAARGPSTVGSQRQRPRVASHLALTLAPQVESR